MHLDLARPSNGMDDALPGQGVEPGQRQSAVAAGGGVIVEAGERPPAGERPLSPSPQAGIRARMRLMRPVVPTLIAIAAVLLAPLLGSAAQASAANTWAGAWNSDFGKLTLSASGSGTYEGHYPGTVSGTITGTCSKGTWTQPTNDPPKSGTFKFTMSADGHSFTGDWAYTGGGCGIARSAGTEPASTVRVPPTAPGALRPRRSL